MFRSRQAVVALLLLLSPRVGWTQSATTTGTIAGSVRDATGGLLPGVTVEAASPALIEKVRTVVTDAQGNYRIVDLRPGTYAVTFTLPGFSTFKREGIELSAGFTATVNAELKVGALEETVTVTGASPVVDVQNVRTQQTMTQELLSIVPTAKSYVGMAALTVGVSGGGGFFGSSGDRDVGGNNHEGVYSMTIHGSRIDGGYSIEGMRANSMTAMGTSRRFYLNQNATQEIVAETGGQSAETETSGVSVNVVLREGGNSFHGMAESEYTGKGLQNDNITDALRARGLTREGNKVDFIYSAGGAVGGPIRSDRAWFYAGFRSWETKERQAGVFLNKPELQHTLRYEPDLTSPASIDSWTRDFTTRLTWQAAPKHKVSGVVEFQGWCACRNGLGPAQAPENTTNYSMWPGLLSQANWSHPRTNKLLFEAGFAVRYGKIHADPQPEVSSSDIGVLELSTGLNYGPPIPLPGVNGITKQYNTMFSASYITGSHALKVGLQTVSGLNPSNPRLLNPDFPVQYQLRNGIPVQLLQVAAPLETTDNVKVNLGLFAQDQWTIRRLTLNLGVRFDRLNAYAPASTKPAGYFLPELRFDAVENLPNWYDVNPRLGVAYDLFGSGKTAVKASVGRYGVAEATTIANARNPQIALATRTTRTWNDANGNVFPDCDLRNNAANAECGAVDNRNFGTTVFSTNYDPDYTNGWFKRTYNWQTNVTLQQELGRGVALVAGYFRTWYGNLVAVENAAVTPADFTPYCITAPSDARLPGGGGYELCGLYDINPDKFGLTNNVVRVDHGRSEVFNGADVAVRARFGNGGLLNGGVAIGKTHRNMTGDTPVHNCTYRTGYAPADVESTAYYGTSVQQRLFCVTDSRQDQVKLNAAYPLWRGIQAAAVYQNLPGNNILATLVLPNGQVAPALGRNLGACRGAAVCNATVSLPIIAPGSLREKRASQLDLRFTKTFRTGNTTIRPGFDIYNVLNSSDVLSMVTTYGPNWMRPGTILPARLYKFNMLVNF